MCFSQMFNFDMIKSWQKTIAVTNLTSTLEELWMSCDAGVLLSTQNAGIAKHYGYYMSRSTCLKTTQLWKWPKPVTAHGCPVPNLLEWN